jgi:hypothetical protein
MHIEQYENVTRCVIPSQDTTLFCYVDLHHIFLLYVLVISVRSQEIMYSSYYYIRNQDVEYRISRPIRRTFPPEKCDLNSNCVLYAEGKYLFPNL